MIEGQLDIKIQIREELKKGLIFGLRARLAIGLVLGFVAYGDEVLHLMQTLSHSTRAYIINANGLKGFVTSFDIKKHLQAADESG